jgi:hypothetical protein
VSIVHYGHLWLFHANELLFTTAIILWPVIICELLLITAIYFVGIHFLRVLIRYGYLWRTRLCRPAG